MPENVKDQIQSHAMQYDKIKITKHNANSVARESIHRRNPSSKLMVTFFELGTAYGSKQTTRFDMHK